MCPTRLCIAPLPDFASWNAFMSRQLGHLSLYASVFEVEAAMFQVTKWFNHHIFRHHWTMIKMWWLKSSGTSPMLSSFFHAMHATTACILPSICEMFRGHARMASKFDQQPFHDCVCLRIPTQRPACPRSIYLFCYCYSSSSVFRWSVNLHLFSCRFTREDTASVCSSVHVATWTQERINVLLCTLYQGQRSNLPVSGRRKINYRADWIAHISCANLCNHTVRRFGPCVTDKARTCESYSRYAYW